MIVISQAFPRQARRALEDILRKTPTRIKKVVPDAMEKIQESSNFRLNALTSKLAPLASDPEEILRGKDDPSFYTTFQKPLTRGAGIGRPPGWNFTVGR